MSPNLEPDEVAALTEAAHDPSGGASTPQVEQRDFSHPHRLGARVLEDLRQAASAAMTSLGGMLGDALGARCATEITGFRETSADSVRSEAGDPPAMVRFRAGGQPGWVVWQNRAAIDAIEGLLGSRSTEKKERPLSEVELEILLSLLSGVASAIGEALGVVLDDFEIVRDVDSIGTWLDGGEGADPHRLRVDIEVEGLGEPSTILVYVPGVQGPEEDDPQGTGGFLQQLPDRLKPVEVDVTAVIGHAQIALADLLTLEEGDVIPLGVHVGEPIDVLVEDRPFARAEFGQRENKLAVVIRRGPNTEAEEKPGEEQS